MEPYSLILLSCSRDKRSGGKPFDADSRRICSERFLPKGVSRLLDCRKCIRTLLQGGPPRLYNEDQKGGFRDDRKCNRDLLLGPDFGGTDPGEATYLPAWQRYAGRFFSTLEEQSPEFWSLIANKPVEILFVSGLYGLVLCDELIQEYDCHFSDYTKDQEEKTVAQIWGGVLTDALREFIQSEARRPIKCIYDLVSESTYQGLFHWDKVASSGVKVHHRIFKGIAGPDVLSPLARLLAGRLQSFLPGPGEFQREKWYDLGDHDQPSVEFGFEFPLGSNPLATREGDLDEAQAFLFETYPSLRMAPEKGELRPLALAEHSWRKVRGLAKFDFGVIIVSYAKAVESYLRLVVPGCPPKAGVGEIAFYVATLREGGWSELSSHLHRLANLRNPGGAHPGRKGKEDVIKARDLALKIILGAVAIAGKHGRPC